MLSDRRIDCTVVDHRRIECRIVLIGRRSHEAGAIADGRRLVNGLLQQRSTGIVDQQLTDVDTQVGIGQD